MFRRRRQNLARRFFAGVILEELTDVLHPDFGSFWVEGGEGAFYLDEAALQGWCECLNNVTMCIQKCIRHRTHAIIPE